MGETSHNLLTDPLFRAHLAGSGKRLTLPEVLAHLGARRELELAGLRPHQQQAWHAFTVQLAALVAHRRGDRRLDLEPKDWRQGLLELTGDAGEAAWCLVVEDLASPAFLQTAVPEGSLAGYRKTLTEPDELDVLITAKNHDLKQATFRSPRPEHWAYSLVTLQTMEGFLGRGNYGIARMNGGFASRPAVAAGPGFTHADRFHRDVAVWLDNRPSLTGEEYGYPESGGHALLWLLPWDGESGRALTACDPFFIEVCRRVRMTRGEDGALVARTANTSAAFLNAKEVRGDTGDVWMPIRSDRDGTLALTVGGSGFSYRLLTDLLFSGDYPRQPALRLRPEDGPSPLIVAQVLVRGQGKTEGLHQRLVPIPPRVRPMMGAPEGREVLGALARARIERAGEAERRVLKPALCALLQGGPQELNYRDERPRPWLDRLDRAIDAVFFEELWADAPLPGAEADRRWDRRLYQLAKTQLEAAVSGAPTSPAVQPRAVARADLLFHRAARKYLPHAFSDANPRPTDQKS